MRRSTATFSGTVLALLLTAALLAPAAAAAPPGIPDAATARAELAALTVAPPGSMAGYSRRLFPHWTSRDGCSTREEVLKRDGEGVTVDADCRPVSGTWYSPYDDVTVPASSRVDIDHVVPLAEAWRSGADAWTTDRREAFANDLGRPQLIAASAASNRSKGDQDPAEWQPRAAAYHCTYGKMWVRAKYHWQLTIDDAERTALREMLSTC
ncbi:HNH endonuclease family protein [Streptomyces sp. MP131-18]|uniref:HNH endonuclease family protein n=1 Tax=Streptomyces sp. MP131-18 TaxID=1857892 RepID=UPI00097C4530|nr:HNH endonuclease family protein [Streptomyces sp. MP131-18]ONK11956.1 hypothetical protein STBA_26920 [Streptomyces sp. MP131-18]